jgi:hypothetical protein
VRGTGARDETTAAEEHSSAKVKTLLYGQSPGGKEHSCRDRSDTFGVWVCVCFAPNGDAISPSWGMRRRLKGSNPWVSYGGTPNAGVLPLRQAARPMIW